MCGRTRGWVRGRGFRETENEKPGQQKEHYKQNDPYL